MRHPPLWHSAFAWVDYCYPWNTLITRWKFGQQPALAFHFARWMERTLSVSTLLQQVDVVLPVPLSAQRMRERGYNPAAQLALHLGKSKCQLFILKRTHHTAAQSGLSRAQRLRNLQHAFAIERASALLLQNQRVLLVDDVMTTGATLAMASQCVLQAGAAQVQVLSMARTP